MRSLQTEKKLVFPGEHIEETPIDPLDWWIYKKAGLGYKHPERYMGTSPYCRNAEFYYLLYILQLQNQYSDKKNIPATLLKNATVYEYGVRKKYTRALVLEKSSLTNNKNQEYSFGERSQLIVEGPLTGTICQQITASPPLYPDTPIAIQAIRPLTFNPTWVIDTLNSISDPLKISTMLEHIEAHELALYKSAINHLKKNSYLNIIIDSLLKMQFSIDNMIFEKNSKIPKFKKKRER